MEKSFFDQLTPFDQNQYSNLSQDSLLAYSLDLLKSNSMPVTFETLVVAVYKLFPDTFSLVGFPEYPDAARINRSLLHARPKYRNLIDGSAKIGFSLTKNGRDIAEQTKRILAGDQEAPISKKSRSKQIVDRTFDGSKIVNKIESSKLYTLWATDRLPEIGPYDIWSFLDALPYTEKSTLELIISNYRDAARLMNRPDILKFLEWVTKDRYKRTFTNREGNK